MVRTRSQTRIAAKKAYDEDLHLEATFRMFHRNRNVLINVSDLDLKHRVMWWATGLDEGTITDDMIPEKDRGPVELLLRIADGNN
jgi:hypothetical protein